MSLWGSDSADTGLVGDPEWLRDDKRDEKRSQKPSERRERRSRDAEHSKRTHAPTDATHAMKAARLARRKEAKAAAAERRERLFARERERSGAAGGSDAMVFAEDSKMDHKHASLAALDNALRCAADAREVGTDTLVELHR
jgi:hypothetical protein